MERTVKLPAILAVMVTSCGALADPVGHEIEVTTYLWLEDGGFLQLYDAVPHHLAGGATLLEATSDLWNDLLVTSSVSTIDGTRTIELRWQTPDGQALLSQEAVDQLGDPGRYHLDFTIRNQTFTDDDWAGSDLIAAGTLLDVFGQHHESTPHAWDRLSLAMYSYISTRSPAGPDFFGTTPMGHRSTYSYEVVPAPGVFAVISVASVAMSARPRRRCPHERGS